MEEFSPVVKKSHQITPEINAGAKTSCFKINAGCVRENTVRAKISKNNVEKYHDELLYFVGVSAIATNRTYVFVALI